MDESRWMIHPLFIADHGGSWQEGIVLYWQLVSISHGCVDVEQELFFSNHSKQQIEIDKTWINSNNRIKTSELH